jgi:hypothetical protein
VPQYDSPDNPPATNLLAFVQELVEAHLLACPADAQLSRKRLDAQPTLYNAVAGTFPEIERLRLTPPMWDAAIAAVMDKR